MRSNPANEPESRDLIDEAMELPVIGEGLTRLQRMLGPSCLASLVILLLLTVLFRRWVHLPWVGMVVLLFVIWVMVLSVLVRFRNMDPDSNIQPGRGVKRQK